MKHKVLLVEDAKEIFTMVSQALKDLADVSWAATIQEAKPYLDDKSYDLILLDVELPDGNGIELCTQLQSEATAFSPPIFILTSHDSLSEKVLGFSAGADDYISKPFQPLELRARIEAKIRKMSALRESANMLSWKEIEISTRSQEVQVLNDEKFELIELTALEFKMLTYFANNVGKAISRDEMLNEIWGEDINVYPRSVDTHVSKLRKKLGPASEIIESVHGFGYKFNPSKK